MTYFPDLKKTKKLKVLLLVAIFIFFENAVSYLGCRGDIVHTDAQTPWGRLQHIQPKLLFFRSWA